MPFSFDAAFKGGYNTFKSRYGSLLAAVVVFILVMVAMAVVSGVLNAAAGIKPEPGQTTWIDLLVSIFFTNVFTIGIALLALQLHRGESPGMSTLFAGFGRYWPLVGIGVLMILIFVAPVLVVLLIGGVSGWILTLSSGSEMAFGPAFFIAAIVGLCLIVFFIVRLSFVALLCVDPRRRLGVAASFATSWRATGPVFWPLLGLIIVMGLILGLSVVLLVLPVIFVGIPLYIAVLVAAYELVMGDGELEQGDTGVALDATEPENATE